MHFHFSKETRLGKFSVILIEFHIGSCPLCKLSFLLFLCEMYSIKVTWTTKETLFGQVFSDDKFKNKIKPFVQVHVVNCTYCRNEISSQQGNVDHDNLIAVNYYQLKTGMSKQTTVYGTYFQTNQKIAGS